MRNTTLAISAVPLLLLAACGGGTGPGADADADAIPDTGADTAFDPAADSGEDAITDTHSDWDPDGPVTLGPVVRLTDTLTDSQTFLNTAKCVAVDDAGTVHVAWLEVTESAGGGHATLGQVFHVRSTDGGATFGAPTALTGLVADVGVPKLATAGGSVFAAWHQMIGTRVQVMFARSEDRGATWPSPALQLGQGTFPSIDAWWPGSGEPLVHVAWSDSQNEENHCEIYLASSTDAGRTFAAPVMVSEPDGLSSWTAAVASWDRTVHVAWTDERYNVDSSGLPYDCIVVGGGETCHEEEFYRRSTDGGLTFPDPEVRLTSDPPGSPRWSWAPSIMASHDDVHIAFFDARTGSFEIYYRRSRDGGATWEGERCLTCALDPTELGRWRPSLAAIGDRLEIAFWVPVPGGDSAALAMRSYDGGDSWTIPLQFSDGPAAVHPAVALSSSGVAHLAWYDRADGNDEMFYRTLSP